MLLLFLLKTFYSWIAFLNKNFPANFREQVHNFRDFAALAFKKYQKQKQNCRFS